MAGQTTHFHMSLREASDIFNPLSTNDNFETIDAKLYQLEQEGGIIGYTGTVSNKLLTLSGTPVANDTIFKFIPDGDCDTVTFSGAVRNIVGLDNNAVTLKANTLYVGWMTSSTMKTLAWPDSINATTLGGNAVEYYATAGGLETVKSTAETAVQTAQAAQTIANNALETANTAISSGGLTLLLTAETPQFAAAGLTWFTTYDNAEFSKYKLIIMEIAIGSSGATFPPQTTLAVPLINTGTPNQARGFAMWTNNLSVIFNVTFGESQLFVSGPSNLVTPFACPYRFWGIA